MKNTYGTGCFLLMNTGEKISLHLPKFKFSYDLDFQNDLIKMGMTDAFDGKKANFTNISSSPLYVNKALHKANIELSEEGIKASATTAFRYLII